MEDKKSKVKITLPNKGRSRMLPIFFICGLFLFFVFAYIFSKPIKAATAPSIITYQGKLLIGNRLATTTQSMYFVLYDAASAGTALYTAAGTIGSPSAISITPSQGLFSVNLGDSGTNPLDPAIFQNNGSVYLEVRIGADTLTPRKRITSVPYAFNAQYIDGVGVNSLSSTTYIPKSDSSGNFTFNSTTISTSTITNLTVLANSSFTTITAGVWNGTAISAVYGGTGQNSSAWTGLVRVTAGVWATTTVALTTDVTGVLSIANGGTNSSTIAANGSIIYSDGTRYNATAVGSAGQILQSTGSGAPVWVSTSSLGFGTGNYASWTLATSTDDLGYSVTSGVKVVFSGINGVTTTRSGSALSVGLTNSGVTAGTYGSASAVPVFTIDAFGRVTANSTSSIAIAGDQITSGVVSSTNGGTGQNSQAWTGLVRVTGGVWSTTTINLASDVSGILPIANGGTNSSTIAANGSVIYSDGTRYNAVAVGNTGQLLQSTGSGAPVWVSTSSLGFSIYNNWLLATSTDDSGYSVTSGVKVILSGINGVTTTRSNNSLSIGLTNSGITAGTYGSASAVPVFTIDAFGRVTANSTSSIAINGNQITSGVVSSTNGGTGQNSQSWTGLVRVTGGVWSTTTVALTTDVTGVLSIANGGTNSSTIAANGSIIYSDGTRYNATAVGASGQILQSTGSGAPVWVSTSSLGFIHLQGSTPGAQQIGHFNISGTGIIGDDLAIGTSTIISRLTVQGDGTRNPFSILSSTASTMFTVLTNGNVGIGTSSPVASLSLVGTADIDPLNIVSSAGSSLLMITANGKVGIGTSTPAQKLSVVGNISNLIDPTTEISHVTSAFLQPIFPLSVFVSGRYAYVAGDINKLGVVDLSDPSNPTLIASTTVGVSPWSVFVSGRYAYTANSTSNTISVVDISNPTAPTQVATTSVGSDPYSVFVSGRYAYTANRGSNSISVVDISNPTAPTQVATTSVGTNPTSIAVSGRYAYVANNGSSNISVVDISNPTAPVQLSTVTVGLLPRSIAVSGRYAYVVSQSGVFSVVDISNPTAPTQVATTSAGSFGLYLSGRYAYVTNHSSDSVIVVDVSNPLAPTPVKTVGVEDTPYSIFVSGRYAYVGNYGTGSLSVVDISGTEVSSLIAHSAEFGSLQSRNDIFAQGNIMAGTSLTVGAGGIFSQGGLSIFASSTGATSSIVSIVTPQAPNALKVLANGNIGIGTSTPVEKLSVVGNISNITDTSTTISVVSSTGTMTGPRSVFVSGKYAYVVGDQATSNFRVFDVTTFSSTTILVASTTLPGAPRSVYVSGQYAYVALTTSNTIGVVDITNPSRPTLVATASVGTDPQTVFVSGKYLYVTNASSNTLSIIDISNPRSPVLMSSISSGGTNPYGLYVSGRYAYVTHLVSGHITAIDVSNPSSPVVAGSAIMSSGQSQSIYVSGRYGYVAAGLGDLIFIVDFANPASPVLIASTTTGSGTVPRSIFVSGRYAYVANQTNSISIIDIANPYRPQRLQNVSVSGAPINIFVSGRYAYVANNTGNTLSVLDISGTEVSSLIAHSAEVGNLQSRNDLFAQGNIMAGTSLMVGAGGILSQGGLSIFASSTGPTTSVFSIDTVASSSIIRVLANGNIGIGTSAPSSALHIGGNGALSFGTTPATTGYIRMPNNSSMITYRNAANTADFVAVASDSSNRLLLGNATNATLFLGDVGFSGDNLWDIGGGTRSPRHIFAKSTLTAGGATSFATLSVQGSGTANPFEVRSSSAASMFTILTNGRIGVNSSSPIASFSVQGNDGTNPLEIASSTGASMFRILTNGNIGINSSSPLALLSITGKAGVNLLDITSSTGASLLRVLQNGNIGIGTSTPAQKLSVVGNISNIIDPNTSISQVGTTSVASGPTAIFVSGRYAYTANFDSDSISVIDVSNPTAPVQVATTSLGANALPSSIFVSGRYAYTTNQGLDTISVVDISNPSAPRQVATTSVGTGPSSIYVSGRYAYVANSNGDTVSVVDIGNPLSPRQVAATSLAVGSGPSSIYVSGRYAYTANNLDSTISVIDISNPIAPVQVATTSVGATPTSIYVSGRYAYVINSGDETMSVVDVKNPAAPTQVAVTGASGGYRVYVSGRYAYVSSYLNSQLNIIDVLNPSAPQPITSVVVGSNPNGIYVSGRYAYVANQSDNTISVVDISGTEVSSLMAHSAEVGNLQSRNDIFAQGNIMAGTALSVGAGGIMSQGSLSIFASSTGSTASSSIFSIATPQAPAILKVLANGNIGIGTTTPTQKLSVVGNIENIIDSSTAVSQIATTSVGKEPRFIFVSGQYAYLTNASSNTISVVDISRPTVPVQIATTSVGTNPYGLYVSGRYAYVVNNSGPTLSVVDISNPKFPHQVATVSVGTGAQRIHVAGKYAYINYDGGGMSVVDISNPRAPALVTSTAFANTNPTGITVSGRYAYLAEDASRILVVDISNPAVPVLLASTTVGTSPQDIAVSGRYAYVANGGSDTISVVDISNPSAPTQVATTTVGDFPNAVFISGRYAYVANGFSNNVSVVDIANPLAPRQINTISLGANIFGLDVFVSGRYAYTANFASGTLAGTMSVLDISGTEVSSLLAHSAEVGNFQSRNDIFAQGNIMAGTSLSVGAGGILSSGALSIFASTTGATSSIFNIDSAASSSIFKVFANGRVSIGTSTFAFTSTTLDVQGLVEVNLASSTGATFALCHADNGGTANQIIYDCGGTPAADYMEMYAADAGLQMGDVVVLSNNFVTTADGNSIPKLSKSTAAYQSGLVGIISNPAEAGDFNSIGHNVAEGDNPLPLALSGRVRIKVTNINGDIHVGDKLTSSNIPGVAMKATEEGPTIAIAMGDYTSAEVGTVMAFVNLNWNNSLYRALTLDTSSKTITVGSIADPHDLLITGNISLTNTNIVNKLSFASSTLFESSVANFSGARAFTFNAINFTGPLADNYIISLRANNNSVFSVAANGDVHALGNYYGASAILGTSTNPGDLAERVDIAMDDIVEAGDVVMVDRNAPDTYRRSDTAYEESVAGVISTNPTIVVGNGRTDYTAVMAMVGRVPVKVSGENGAIVRGDLLVAASRPGYAMKYDATKDKNNKMVGVIGVALESLQASSTGKILSLIRTGWVYNRDKDIENLKNDIEQMAVVQGINLAASSTESGNLSVEDNNNQLVYTGGNLDLQNNALINVASILGKNNKWKIDEFGNLIQKIATSAGEKEIYGLQSTAKQEIVISGTSTLQNGTRRVVLTDLDQAVIDKTVPLKISITMSGETNGFYVAERSYDSFVVKENGNGQSNAEFDWIVIAKVRSAEGSAPAPEVPAESSADTPDSSVSASDTESSSSTPPVEISEPTTTAPIVEEVEENEETVPPVEETVSDASIASSTP